MIYDLGQTAILDFDITDDSGVLVNPAGTVLTVTSPTGLTTTPSLTTVGVGKRRALVSLGLAGVWRWSFATTSPNDQRDGVLVAAASLADVPWLPSPTDVADLVPARTQSQATPGVETWLGTFTPDTVPTGAQVERIIAGAAAHVSARTGTVDPTLYGLAQVAAATRAAAWVEVAFPDTNNQVDIAATLTTRADLLLTDLVNANTTLGGVPGTPATSSLPIWQFPDPMPYGDLLI